MTNKERVMTILWLEAGMYRSETVAKKFGMSVSQLEAEAAIFRLSPLYKQKYASFVEQQKEERLSGVPFSEWRDYSTCRTLANGRVEIIVGEHEGEELYHAYIPNKEYFNNICDHTIWVGLEAFRFVINYEQVGRWKQWPVEAQLRFLLARFDSDTFLCYRSRITKEEYERLTGRAYPTTTKKNRRINMPTFRTDETMRALRHVEPGKKASVEQLGQMLSGNSLSYFEDNKTTEVPLTDELRNACFDLLRMSDTERLERLSTEGPTEVEMTVFWHMDRFYDNYQLSDLFREGNREGIKRRAASALEWSKRKSEAFEQTRMLTKPRQRGIKPMAAGRRASVLSDLERQDRAVLVERLRKASADEEGERIAKELLDYRERLSSAIQRQAVNERVAEEKGKWTDAVRDMVTRVLSGKAVPDQDIMGRRAELLKRLRENQGEEDLRALQETEDVLTRLDPSQRPSFYPEQDLTLLYLYVQNKLKTLPEISQKAVSQASPADSLSLYNLINQR